MSIGRRMPVRGLLADVNCEGYVRLSAGLLEADSRRELWQSLEFEFFEFSDVGLDVTSSDRTVWHRAQSDEMLLITANRNARDDDSLQAVIDEQNAADSLPIITISNPRRLARDADYANGAADRLLEYLFDIDNYYGTGRLFLP